MEKCWDINVTTVMDKHILGWKGLRGRRTDRLRAFVTDGKVLGQNCDGRTCFGTEMGMENLAEDGNQDIRTKTKSLFKLDSTAQCVTC